MNAEPPRSLTMPTTFHAPTGTACTLDEFEYASSTYISNVGSACAGEDRQILKPEKMMRIDPSSRAMDEAKF